MGAEPPRWPCVPYRVIQTERRPDSCPVRPISIPHGASTPEGSLWTTRRKPGRAKANIRFLQTPFAALGVRVGVGMDFFFPTSFLRMFCSSCRPFMRCCECVAPMPAWVMHVCVCVWVMWAGMGDGWAWAICASVRMICRWMLCQKHSSRRPTKISVAHPPPSTQPSWKPHRLRLGARYIYMCVAAAGGVGFTTKLGVRIHRVLDSRSSCYMARSSREG